MEARQQGGFCGRRFRLLICLGGSLLFGLSAGAAVCTWTGAVDSDWNNAANWDGGVPSGTDDVVIPDTTHDPVISSSVNIASLDVGAGAIVMPASDAVITGTGSITGSGTIQVTRITAGSADLDSQYNFSLRYLSGLTAIYSGTGDQTINGRRYENLTVDGGGVKTPEKMITVDHAVEIEAGTTLDMSTKSLVLRGVGSMLQVRGTLDFTASGGYVRSEDYSSALTVGGAGRIRTVDAAGLGPDTDSNPSFQSQNGGAWDFAGLADTGTVEYAFSGDQVVTAHGYHNLILAVDGSKTLEAGVHVAGNLEVIDTAAMVLDSGGAMTLGVNGNAVFSSGTTLQIGVTAGAGCDQVSVGGALTLNSATLAIGAVDGDGRTFVFATNGISGNFGNYADGAEVQAGFSIHYLVDQSPAAIAVTADGTTSSGIDLRAYQASEGFYVEFVAHEVEADGAVMLALRGADGETLWSATAAVSAGPASLVRVAVPGLEAGQVYDFLVRDEVGTWWVADGVRVGRFEAEMQAMRPAGIEIAFDSLRSREYEVQWVAGLGESWQMVTNITAVSERTVVVVNIPEAENTAGFFRIQAR